MEALIAVGAAIMAVWFGMRRAYRAVRAVEKILEGVEANQAHVQFALSELAEIKHEVKTNGGGSLRDAVNRVEQRVAVLEALELAPNKAVVIEATPHHPGYSMSPGGPT
jgi:hypothetical protein